MTINLTRDAKKIPITIVSYIKVDIKTITNFIVIMYFKINNFYLKNSYNYKTIPSFIEIDISNNIF